MICNFCSSSFLQPDLPITFKPHHQALPSFLESVKAGCQICDVLAADFTKVYGCGLDEGLPKFAAVSFPLHQGSLQEQSVPGTFLLTFYRSWEVEEELDKQIETRTISFSIFPAGEGGTPGRGWVGSSTDGSGTRLLIDHWIRRCKDDHDACRSLNRPKEDPFLPTRLLSISDPDVVKLVKTDNAKMNGERYMTLSYCWGRPTKQKPHFKTIWQKLQSHHNGIPFSSLPATFKDTIQVARRLGISFIWIDALCIIQSIRDEFEKDLPRRPDEDWTSEEPQDIKNDWHTEAPQMEKVYGHSFLNVAAVDSNTSYEGCFRERVPQDIELTMVDGPVGGKGKERKFSVARTDFWQSELLDGSLYSRGWVFQERMLSRRLLHFAHNQVFWECPSLQACETFPAGLPKQLLSRPKQDLEWKMDLAQDLFDAKIEDTDEHSNRLENFWTVAVRFYTSCALTNSSDKIPAFLGISNRLHDAFGTNYLKGLWDDRLEEQLAWNVVNAKQANGSPSERLLERAPSWSWVSVDGVIEPQIRIYQERYYRLRATPAGNNPDILNATGQVYKLPFMRNPETPSELFLRHPKGPSKPFFKFRALIDVSAELPAQVDILDLLVLLVVYTKNPERHVRPGYTGYGIVIEKKPGSDNVYLRRGAVQFEHLTGLEWRALEKTADPLQAPGTKPSYARLSHEIVLV